MFITRLHRVPTLRDRFDYLSSTHSPRSAGRRCLLQRFESALDVQRLGNRGQLCETKRGNAPLDMRAIPKAPHSAFGLLPDPSDPAVAYDLLEGSVS